MIYYLTAYVIFWTALFGYLMSLSRRQERLNVRASALVDRLAKRGGDAGRIELEESP